MATQTERLGSLLAHHGFCSRRGAHEFLQKHTVAVNSTRVFAEGTRVRLSDDVRVNGKRLTKTKSVYYALHKRPGTIATVSDEFGRTSVLAQLPKGERIYPIGRLDKNTTGLILVTNDGDLAHRVTHPRYTIEKVYRLHVHGVPTKSQMRKLASGVLLKDGKTAPASVTNIYRKGKITQFDLTIHEGRNRQIRRMCESVGVHLRDLKRIQIGPVLLRDLKEGAYRQLTKAEVRTLKESVEKT